MNVKNAKDHIKRIEKICDEAYTRHSENPENADFYTDITIFLCEYRRILAKAIDEAELSL